MKVRECWIEENDPFGFVDEKDAEDAFDISPSDEDIFYFTLEYVLRGCIADPAPDSFEECRRRVESAELDDPMVEAVLLAIAVALYDDLDGAHVRREAGGNALLRRVLRSSDPRVTIGRAADPALEVDVLAAAGRLDHPTGVIRKLFAALVHYHYVQTASIYASNGMGMSGCDVGRAKQDAAAHATRAISHVFGDEGLLEILAGAGS